MNSKFVVVGDESLTVECLKLLTGAGGEVGLVISRSAPVRDWAESAAIPARAALAGDVPECDYLLSIANLRMLPSTLLSAPRIAAINFHDGPLPLYAGLNAPIWALIEGANEYGITWHLMVEEADTGDILEQELFELDTGETALSLNTRCFEAGLSSFSRLISRFESGNCTGQPQDFALRAYYGFGVVPPNGGVIDPTGTAEAAARLVRALDFGHYANPLGSAWLANESGAVRVAAAQPATEVGRAPGEVFSASGDELGLAFSDGALLLSGLSESNGASLSPQGALEVLGLGVGGLFLPSREWLASAGELAAAAARGESRALSALRNAKLELPFLRNDIAGRVSGPQRLSASLRHVSPGRTTAALGRYLSALTGADATLFVASSERAARTPQHQPLFDSYVPVVYATGASSESAEKLAERALSGGPVSRDLAARQPGASLDGPRDRVGIVFGNVQASDGFALLLACREDGSAEWHYQAERFSDEDVRTVDEAFAEFLAQSPTGAEASSLASGQRARLASWNATEVDFDRAATIVSAFEARVDASPAAVALSGGGRSLAYAELDRRANRVAHKLIALGAGPDRLVAVHLERSLDLVVALLGVLKAGAAYVPVDPEYPEARKALMIEDSGARLVICERTARFPGVDATLVHLTDEDLSADDSRPALRAAAENLSYVIYTSGSTGRPKGVMLEHRNVVNFFHGMDDRVGSDPGVWLAVTSISFDISVLELLWTLTRGFEVVLNGAREVSTSNTPALSVFFFGSDPGSPEGSYDLLFAAARFADQHGFEAVWTPERHFHAFGGAFPNPSVTSAAIAAATKHVSIRAGSCVLPLHSPIRVAEEWALVDQISRGRVGVSFATGWQPNDFVLNPAGYGTGKAGLIRDVEQVRALWRGAALEFPGHDGAPVSIQTLPRPVQQELPTWLTSAGDVETFRLAGERGYNILTHLLGQSVEELAGKIAVYRAARAEAGHNGPGQVTLMLHSYVSESDADARETVREPMIAYLRSSVGLIRQFATSFPTFKGASDDAGDLLANLDPADLRELLEFAFERYYETSGLFGDAERAAAMLRQVKAGGVDEVACLVDFGVDHTPVMASLERIAALREGEEDSDHDTIPELMRRHAATHFQCTPSMAGMLAGDPDFRAAARSLDVMMVGGEAFPVDLAKSLASEVGGRLVNMYGPTETTIWSTTSDIARGADGVSIGTPIANTSIYILGANRQALPPGAVGELWIGGEGVARGYLNRRELTAERFVPDPFTSKAGARMYRTGDLAKFERDGTITFLGRVDQQVKVRGYRVEPGEIESIVRAQETIADAVVIAREDTPGDQRLVCYFVPRSAAEVDTQALRDHIGQQVPVYMVPTNFVKMAALPLTPNKKVDRNALPPPGAEASAVPTTPRPVIESSAAPATTTHLSESAVALVTECWRDVLKTADLPMDRTFFDCGGNSLLMLQLHKKLLPHHADLRLTDLFRHTTIRSLASYLGDNAPSTAANDDISRRALARRSALAGRRPVHA
jgi:natural product biosynthesis luciferase-like monooxygenase protein